MTDEKDTKVEGEQKPELTEVEQRALELGWQPKDDWEGDPEEWIPARQYIKNGELFGRINADKHRISSLENAVKTLITHNEKVYEAGYKDAVASLKQEKKAALLEGDTETVVEIEEKLENLQEQHTKQKTDFYNDLSKTQVAPINPAWEPWANTNSWYGKDTELTGYADGVAKGLVKSSLDSGLSVDYPKLLNEVSRKVRQRFPEKFEFNGNGRSSSTNKGDEKSGAGRKSNKTDGYQLTETEEEVFKTLSKHGMTREKYVTDLLKVKSRKGA